MIMCVTDNYTGTETYQILLPAHEVAEISEEWIERKIESDLRLRRAKTEGCVVVETRDVIFARNIIVWHPGCQVNIKR